MSVQTPVRSEAAIEGPRRWRWTGDQVIRLSNLGLLPREGRFEVMDGEIIEHLPPNPLHAALAGIVAALLKGVFEARGYCVREEKPIRLKEYFDPQPDVAVVRGRPRDYLERFPAPQEVALLVEIAESSLAYDRGRKRSAYAAAGIAEYWILDLEQAQVEGYREPSGGEYLSHRIYKLEESVSPLAAPDAFLQVAALLGRE